MACSKYTLTNTGTTVAFFNYKKCDDTSWQYQNELFPNQTKNIWLVNGTYSSISSSIILGTNDGVFPPTPSCTRTPTPTPTETSTETLTPTPTQTQTPTNTETLTPTPTNTQTKTPTQTQTPTNTQTQTQTPTNTQTQTQTPTNTQTQTQTPTNTQTQTPTPTKERYSFSVGTGVNANDACDSVSTTTIYAENSLFDTNTQFYDDVRGSVMSDMTGFYSYSSLVVELTAGGTETGGFVLCSIVPTQTPTSTLTPTQTQTPTNTETLTPTPTNTQTPTNTETLTPTPTPTFGYYEYTLGTGATANDACTNYGGSPITLYAPPAQGPGPNVSEILYQDSGLTIPMVVGYLSDGTAWYSILGGAPGQITSSDPNGC